MLNHVCGVLAEAGSVDHDLKVAPELAQVVVDAGPLQHVPTEENREGDGGCDGGCDGGREMVERGHKEDEREMRERDGGEMVLRYGREGDRDRATEKKAESGAYRRRR